MSAGSSPTGGFQAPPLPSLDFSESTEFAALRLEAREMAADGVRRFGAWNDSWIIGFSREFSRELAARGWIGLTWPPEFGGGGRPPIERMVVFEELIAAGAPVAASWFADRQIGPSLIAFGTAEQQKAFLPGIISGEDTWCIGMSEPGAGSDLAAVSTRARRDGDEYVIEGQKIWTSGAALSKYCYLVCRTSGDPSSRHGGISEIIVPLESPGIEVKPIQDLAGDRHFCEVFYNEARVPAENLVGTEGGAFKQSMRQLEHERGGIDRLVSNLRSYRRILELVDLNDPLIRQEIAAIESGYRIGRLLVAREGDRTGAPGLFGRDQNLLHRPRAKGGKPDRPSSRHRRLLRRPAHQGVVLCPRIHDHGGNIERPPQHPRREGPWASEVGRAIVFRQGLPSRFQRARITGQ